MSKNKAKSAKFNAIDALIILLVIACIASIVYKAVIASDVGGDSDLAEYRVYFKIDDIKSTSAGYFHTGDTVRLKNNGREVGVLDGIVQHVPAVGAYNENGEEVFYPDIPDQTITNDTRYSLVGYITVRGEMTDKGFLLNGESYVAPNSTLDILTEWVDCSIRIISINEK